MRTAAATAAALLAILALDAPPARATFESPASQITLEQAYPGLPGPSWGEPSEKPAIRPHDAYVTCTPRCATCHARHERAANGEIDVAAEDASSPYVQGCAWCHDGGFAVRVAIPYSDDTADSSVRFGTHYRCTMCHSATPHGTSTDELALVSTESEDEELHGLSRFPVLSRYMLNDRADAAIEQDIETGENGTVESQFDGHDGSAARAGLTLGTGYLCSSCHSDADGSPQAFAVNAPGATPASADGGSSPYTGHRTTAEATERWNSGAAFHPAPGRAFDPTAPTGYNARYRGRIAWAPANTCQSCHDAKLADGRTAFPHGYTDAQGSPVPLGEMNASLLWLSGASATAAYRANVGTFQGSAGWENPDELDEMLTNDGLCLKCHLDQGTDSGEPRAGVGITY